MDLPLESKEAFKSIVNTLKTSPIFKDWFNNSEYKDKLENLDDNIDTVVERWEQMDELMNKYKLILFISKNKEDFFDKLDNFMVSSNGYKLSLSDEHKERLYEKAREFQTFVLMLEHNRAKYENKSLPNWEKVLEKTNKQYDEEIHQMIQDSQNNLNSLDSPDSHTIQSGGRNTMVRMCYHLDKPLPLKIPTIDVMNLLLEHDEESNSYCMDIEFPQWPSMEGAVSELFNKTNIKDCIRVNCMSGEGTLKESPEKQQCVQKCFDGAEPSIFDYVFFPIWSLRKKDPFGIIGIGVDFMKFSLNNMDLMLKRMEPYIESLMKLLSRFVGFIPIGGNIIIIIKDILDKFMKKFGSKILKYMVIFINLQEKNFEDAFVAYSELIPNFAAQNNAMLAASRFAKTFLDGPILNTALNVADKVGTFSQKVNPATLFGNMVKMMNKDRMTKPP